MDQSALSGTSNNTAVMQNSSNPVIKNDEKISEKTAEYSVPSPPPPPPPPTSSSLESNMDYQSLSTASKTPAEEEAKTPTVPVHSLQSKMWLEEGYLALGTIRLENEEDSSLSTSLKIISPRGSSPCRDPWFNTAVRKSWVKVEKVVSIHAPEQRYLRVYVLPEDVDRRNRGSLKDFRAINKTLLNFVNRSPAAWMGTATDTDPFQFYETPRTTEEESLFYIFNTLRSPNPDPEHFRTSAYGYQAVSNVLNNSIPGLKTELYPYQRRSIAAMIQRETEPAKLTDPRKPMFHDMYGGQFYLDVSEGALMQNPPLYDEPQGGILAETMGYGKTLICICLILATRGHYPKFPSCRVDTMPLKPRDKVGSLLAMAAQKIKHAGIPWKAEFHALRKAGFHFDRCLKELDKYDRAYAEPIWTSTTPERAGRRDPFNVVRLCAATLIIVPPNLLTQWQSEIQKHTESDALDILIIDLPSIEVPQWKQLLKYDVVIITKARFEQEYRDDDLQQGRINTGGFRYRSPLTDVRWLRVICDEGHGFAGSSSRTNAMAMLDNMYIDRKWVVSGTPSSTLHGVEVGLSTTTSSSTDESMSTSPSPAPDPVAVRKISLHSALQKRRAPTARDLEAKDLERLRLIVVNFLQLRPWANQRGSSDVANWKQYVAPGVDSDGNHYTLPALRDVLQSLIIRHRIEDIDTDLVLPPLHNRTVYLEPSYHDKLSINMFFLFLSANYVTSERQDEDYMFHPRNRKVFDQLINNLRQASFHWIGFTEHQIRETIRVSNEYLNKNVDKVSEDDVALLTEAIINGERALADPTWRAFSTLHEIGVYVTNFPEHAREAWALDGEGSDPLVLGTVQAREVQQHMKSRIEKGSVDPLSGLAGAGIKAMNAARSRAEDERKAQQTSKATSNDNEMPQVGAIDEPKLKSTFSSTSKTPLSAHPISTTTTTQKRKRPSSPTMITPPQTPQLSSTLPTTTITSFTSSKLTYLTSRLLTLPPSTKSLVFYQHNNTAFFIAEALELVGIPFRIYANTLSVSQRNTYLAAFNDPDSTISVLLMDIKQAALGLHVACASYVCIVSPIWDAGVESQAIKRAHRIGQTKEVLVETLVLSGTFEEDMVRRRMWKDEHLDDPASRLAGRDLLDDRHMVSVIKNIKFMQFEEGDMGRDNEMDAPLRKRLLFKAVLPDEEVMEGSEGIAVAPPAKLRKGVEGPGLVSVV